MKSRLIKVIALATLATSFLAISPAQAETFVFKSAPLTDLDPAGVTINGGFTAFPSKSGMYIAQCISPVGTARPVTCNDATQLWVTPAGGPNTLSPTGPIAIKVVSSITGKGVTVDCTKTQCGLFFRLDHLATNDFSEDKFIPITFRAGAAAQALPADTIVVTLNGKMLTRNVPSNLGYRAPATIVATTKSGLPVNFSSLTPDCTFANNQFTALKGAGQCALAFSTAGNTEYAPTSGNFPFILVPGEQSVTIATKSLMIGKSKSLPKLSNFGEKVTYRSMNNNCSIRSNVITGKKAGNCQIKASATSKENMWNALDSTFSISIK